MLNESMSTSSSSSSSAAATVNDTDSNNGIDPVLTLLQPLAIDEDYASASDMSFKGDIDSFVIVCRSPEPFICEAYCKLYMKPNVPLAVKNVKYTKYIMKRHEFDIKREPDFEAYRETNDYRGEWFDFSIGTIDGRDLQVVFQMDLESDFFVNVPTRSTSETDGRSAVACSAFMKHVIARVTRRLDIKSESAKAG